MATRKPKPSKSTKRYKNEVAEVYLEMVNTLLEPLKRDFFMSGSESNSAKRLKERWYQKVKDSKAVEEFNKRDKCALSAAERAEAVARRDRQVTYERMADYNVRLLHGGPRTESVETTPIPYLPKQLKRKYGYYDESDTSSDDCDDDDEDDDDCVAIDKRSKAKFSFKTEGVIIYSNLTKPEWTYKPDDLENPPDTPVAVTLKIPVRTMHNTSQTRKFQMQLPAMLLQQNKLGAILNADLLKRLAETPISVANAQLSAHLKSYMRRNKFEERRLSSSLQLDGDIEIDDVDASIEDLCSIKTFFSHNYIGSRGSSESNDSSSSESDSETDYVLHSRRISRKSKEYLRRLFHLCPTSSSSSSSEEERQKYRKKMMKAKKPRIEKPKKNKKKTTENELWSNDEESESVHGSGSPKSSSSTSSSNKNNNNNNKKSDDDNETKKQEEQLILSDDSIEEEERYKKTQCSSDSDSTDNENWVAVDEHVPTNNMQQKNDAKKSLASVADKVSKSKSYTQAISRAYEAVERNTASGFSYKCEKKPDDNIIDDDDDDDEDVDLYKDADSLRTDDDLSSLGSEEETDNICNCLYDRVWHKKIKWHLSLGAGILNVNGKDYFFDRAEIVTKF